MADYVSAAKKIAQKLAEKAPEDVEAAGKIPYKVIAKDGELTLKSPVAKASADFRTPDTIEMMDPEMVPHLDQYEKPVYIEHLEADKGYGAKALSQLEASAKKRGADAAYLNASPVGGTRGLSQDEAARKVQEFYKKNGYEVAQEYKNGDKLTNTMMYKKLSLMENPGGSMAGQIVNKMLPRPDMGLGQAAAAINEPLEKLNDVSGRNELVAGIGSTAAKIVSRIPRSLDNLFSGFERPFSTAEQIAARAAASDPQHLQQQVEPVTQFGANLLVPQAQDMLMGPVGHTLGMAEKGSTAAEKLEQAVDKGFGRTAVVGDSVQPLGRVTVKDLPGETFKGNNQFGKTTVIDPKSLFEPQPKKLP